MPSPSSGMITCAAYARHRGVSAMAVSLAIKSGRLVKSVTRTALGHPRISDVALADQEWDEGTDLSKAPMYVRERAEARQAAHGESDIEPDTHEDIPEEDEPDAEAAGEKELTLAQASTQEKIWKAKLAELKYREEAGELLDAKTIAAKVAGTFLTCRTRLLGIPSRAKQALPHLSTEDVLEIERLVREALEELANSPVP